MEREGVHSVPLTCGPTVKRLHVLSVVLMIVLTVTELVEVFVLPLNLPLLLVNLSLTIRITLVRQENYVMYVPILYIHMCIFLHSCIILYLYCIFISNVLIFVLIPILCHIFIPVLLCLHFYSMYLRSIILE